MTGRRILRVLGLLILLFGLAIAPATGAGAHVRVTAPTTGDAHATPTRVSDDILRSTAPRTDPTCGLTVRRAALGHGPLVADLVAGSFAAGNHPGGRVPVEPARALHEATAQTRCGRGPPAA